MKINNKLRTIITKRRIGNRTHCFRFWNKIFRKTSFLNRTGNRRIELQLYRLTNKCSICAPIYEIIALNIKNEKTSDKY